MFWKIIFIGIGLFLVLWVIYRIKACCSRKKGWLEFQLAAEALSPEQLTEAAAAFREFVQQELQIKLETMKFGDQAQFLYEHLEQLETANAAKYFPEIRIEKFPEQTPYLGMAAYLGELVRSRHLEHARWDKKDGAPGEVVIEYPDDPPYLSFLPFAGVFHAVYQNDPSWGPITLSFADRYILRAEAINRQRGIRYTPQESEAFQQKIKENFGEITMVWHEIVSPDIHIDVLEVRPADSGIVHLITCGMGGYMMPVPEEKRELGDADRLELMVTLPDDWPLTFIAQKKDKNYWPMRMLKDIARYPVDNCQPLGSGHTVQMPTPYADTKFQNILLLPPLDKVSEELRYTLSPGIEVGLLQLIPLYSEERDCIVDQKMDILDRFTSNMRMINPNRPSVLSPEDRKVDVKP